MSVPPVLCGGYIVLGRRLLTITCISRYASCGGFYRAFGVGNIGVGNSLDGNFFRYSFMAIPFVFCGGYIVSRRSILNMYRVSDLKSCIGVYSAFRVVIVGVFNSLVVNFYCYSFMSFSSIFW